MNAFTIRHALETDAPQITALIHLVGINPTGLDWKRFIVAATADGELVGCGQVKPHGSQIRELASIAAHPDWRGQGIARAVIQNLLAEHSKPLYLTCMARNRGLYEKFGFRVLADAELPRYYSRLKKLFAAADIFMRTGGELLVMKLE